MLSSLNSVYTSILDLSSSIPHLLSNFPYERLVAMIPEKNLKAERLKEVINC